MVGITTQDISGFFIAGINYKKSEAGIRGDFAINDEQYETLLQQAPSYGIQELFVLSTCNRTEIYGFAHNINDLIELLCTQTRGSVETFRKLAYTSKGQQAVQHLFEVGAGLDSQILGDYEIVGQIKMAVGFSKKRGFIGAFTERLVNAVLQSSKTIKNQTAISDGTVSVSFSAVQYIREYVRDIHEKNILLVGVGKIGRNTCKNIIDYLDTQRITLINRSPEKAAELAAQLNVDHATLDQLPEHIRKADIILVATNASAPTILKEHFSATCTKLIIDLSIPYNVEAGVSDFEKVTVVNVDELSRLKDQTLKKREAEVPKARKIIAEHMAEFFEWQEGRRFVPALKLLKLKLQEINTDPVFLSIYHPNHPFRSSSFSDPRNIQKAINGMAIKMRLQNHRGCQYLQAFNDYFDPCEN